MVIGQRIDNTGEIIQGSGMIGDLTRFNLWAKRFVASEVRTMAQKCGNEVGNILGWPQLSYWIIGDVEILEGTTCIKPGQSMYTEKNCIRT